MSQITDFLASAKNNLDEASALLDQVSTGITTLQNSQGASQEDIAAAGAMVGETQNLKDKAQSLVNQLSA